MLRGQLMLVAATFILGAGSTLAFQKVEPVVSAAINAQSDDRPPIMAAAARGKTIEQIKAENACNTFTRFGIGTKAPAQQTVTQPIRR